MGARGESIIHVNGHEVNLLFTNRALLSAEKQLGKGILGILDGFMSNTSGYTELVALLRAGMEAARIDTRSSGKPVSNNDAIDLIDEIGFAAALTPVMEAVAIVISYSPDQEDEIAERSSDPN